MRRARVTVLVTMLMIAACNQGGEDPPPPLKGRPPTAGIGIPPDLVTGMPSIYTIRIDVWLPENISKTSDLIQPDATLKQAIEQGFTLRLLPSTTVPGTFTWVSYPGIEAHFKSSSPLKPGAYLAEQKPGKGYEVPGRGKARFWVGSLPRVRSVAFDVKSGQVEDVIIEFTEPMVDLKPHLSVSQGGTAVTPTSGTFAGEGTSVQLFLGISAKQTVKIVVSGQAKAETGQYLDGSYTGAKASPGADFVLDVVPEALPDGYWTPSI